MVQAIMRSITALALGAFLGLMPTVGAAETKSRTCKGNPGHTLQHFLDELNPGDTLLVSGTCNENVVIGEGQRNITIDGQGSATINGSGDPSRATVLIRGRGITIKGFNIVGGRWGINVYRGGTATIDGNAIQGAGVTGIIVVNGGFGQILNNTVSGNGVNGVSVSENSSADIGFAGDFATAASPNTITNNGQHGIWVGDASHAEIESNTITGNTEHGIVVESSSSARIGVRSGAPGTFAGANTIQQNGRRGVVVTRSASARIVDNDISNNVGDGVGVFRASHADIANNKINGNGGHGISVSQNSGVNLGNDSGLNSEDLPNITTVNNGTPGLPGPPPVAATGFGIRCTVNSSADGRLGSLNGYAGAKNFSTSCSDSLNP